MREIIPFERPDGWYLNTGLKYAKRGKYSEALKYMLKACESEPSDMTCYLETVKVLMCCGDYDQAQRILHYLASLSEDPEDTAECFFLLAQGYADAQDYERAILYCRKCCVVAPDGPFVEECESVAEYLESCGYRAWDERWDHIVDLCRKVGGLPGSAEVCEELEDILLNISYGLDEDSYTSFSHVTTWAALLEYTYHRMRRQRTSRKAIAEKYGITDYILKKSVNTVFYNIFL